MIQISQDHLIYLSSVNDPLKRAFYEQEAIKGCWTVKELDRQVSSLYYERMGLSKNKKTTLLVAKKMAETNTASFIFSKEMHDAMLSEYSEDT